ncbi:RtcB family protein [Candidatus Nanohalococcus occultus]|uniref:tRNA-splicing ligase RtcB n=1 Tax=Candidatus Nanohalococcus occultus TaxID=2978047 RepID=A0ABY8CIK2_9ARCH|nr:RNA 3'-P ligase, RtcB family protein [Candidatus Nanohaloarchaeota archaeon SVXNc]
MSIEVEKVEENIYEIPKEGEMNVPARIYASEKLLEKIKDDKTLEQVKNVATLPGIQKHSIVMPDGHQGYGFPIGGVAAVSMENGVVSPGGIGYDINCGVRVLKTDLTAEEIEGHEQQLANIMYSKIPAGLGGGGYIDIDEDELEEVLEKGMDWMLENGHAKESDLERCEENGRLPGDPSKVPEKAKKRGIKQLGSLGSGNHFLEVQRVDEIFNEEVAEKFGLEKDQILVMIHSGSRGLGHQTCTEYLRKFEKQYPEEVESLPDKELIYAPIEDQPAQDYIDAMYAVANFAWCNRQAMTEAIRDCFDRIFGETEIDLVYDVCHNIAKEETHEVDGKDVDVLVHRKGATRAMPKGRKEVPEVYEDVGQPVLIPGTMGTSSYILVGGQNSLNVSFGSTAHGAGRLKSRTQAKQDYWGEDVQRDLKHEGVYVKAVSGSTVAEEAPGAYKDVDEVIKVSDELDIGRKVAKMKPIVNIKG